MRNGHEHWHLGLFSWNMKLIKKKGYYSGEVWEFNLPAGHSCPYACKCLTQADRQTGKQTSGEQRTFRCYAASAERFPAVRSNRWANFEALKEMKSEKEMYIALFQMFTGKESAVRIHGSGDFFNQRYFNAWVLICQLMPEVEFWAFTKSIPYWVNCEYSIPSNFTLTASRGSSRDHLIDKHQLKNCEVFLTSKDAVTSGLPIDTDDTLAREPTTNFALVDNYERKKKVN